jgi:hypothetical protein
MVSWMILPLVGMSLPIILVPVILGLKHARLDREFEHAERMKALELGRRLPGEEPWWSPPRLSVAFGVALPVGLFLCAWKATESQPNYAIAVWAAAAVVGFSGVIGGATLALRHFRYTGFGAQDRRFDVEKPEHHDADAFDVVGSRG